MIDAPPTAFSAWADEIAAELHDARAQLAVALAAVDVAATAHAAAEAAAESLCVALAPLAPQPLASALASRVQLASPDPRVTAGDMARAQGTVAQLRAKIADHELALRQIERLLAPQEDLDAA